MTHFSLATFKIYFLPLCFDGLNMMCLDMGLFWVSPTCNSLNFLDVHINDIHYFFKYLFCGFLSALSGTIIMHILVYLRRSYYLEVIIFIVPLRSLRLCWFYFLCVFIFFIWEVNISETNKWRIFESKHLLKLSEFF